MRIPSHELEAFFTVARTLNFTHAAQSLFVTQSALSQRIQKLEGELETTLFVRGRNLRLTESGQKLLRYCQSYKGLEEEFLLDLKSSDQSLGGILRVAAYSSILRSLLIPTLAPFLRKHTKVHCEFGSFEVVELPAVLERAEADFVVSDYRMNKAHVEEVLLGFEEFVVIESKRYKCPENIYLDHGPHDNATESFFATQKNRPQNYRRSFMGDVYGILDGVEEGFGRAVMSKHLVEERKKLKIVSGFNPYKREVVLHYFKRPYYPKLHSAFMSQLQSKKSVQSISNSA